MSASTSVTLMMISSAFGPWQKLIEDTPRLGHELFYWSRETSKLDVGLGA